MLIYSLAIFVALILTLSLMRERLVYEIAGTSLLIFAKSQPGIILYSIIFLPGTIIHELSHWLIAEILRVKTGEITIFPDFEDRSDHRRLGSVATQKSDPFRGFLIGVAPFFSGLILLTIFGQLLADGWGTFPWWQLALIIYGVVVIGNSMMTSREDRRTWPFIIVFFALIFIVFARMQVLLSPNFYFLTSNILYKLNIILGVTAGLNLVMIVGLYGIRRVIEKITRRRIV